MESNSTKSHKRKSDSLSESLVFLSVSDTGSIFALLLAALSNSCNRPDSISIVKKCLNKLRLSLLSKSRIPSQQTLPSSILSLLPVFLNSKNEAIARGAAEIVGVASISSFEMNEQIACDRETLKALISLVTSSNRRVSIAGCNAVLDLSSTFLGRQQLLQVSALESLMFGFLQVWKSSTSISLCIGDGTNTTHLKLGIAEDKLLVLLFDAAIVLINTCNTEELEKIPEKLSETFLIFLKETWKKVRDQMLLGKISRSSKGKHLSSTSISNLAESLFRLSMNVTQGTSILPSEMVRSSIFGSSGPTFRSFFINYWEVSPFLVQRLSSFPTKDNDIFRSIMESLNSKGWLFSSISSVLQGLISCLPIASDELDIFNFLMEVRNKLGYPVTYEQDIRVLRTEKNSKREVHFFKEILDSCCTKTPFLHVDDILKCQEAFKRGYTIALRGMAFRFESVAFLADGLASLFGQPTAGANLYLTPPNSQGLAIHYDDHCVFVCQLLGTKQWKISSRPIVQLPHLYAPCDTNNGEDVESSMTGCKNLLLKEGDILYIPRGYLHEAFTDDGGPNGYAGFSLHLTLAIEVEPPFEWEGFAHIALCCWHQTQKQCYEASADSLSRVLMVMSVNVLHVIIGLIGNSDPNFRKACLVAATLPSETNSWLYLNQKATFSNIMDSIDATSRFQEALETMEVAIHKNEDPFQRMRWLRFLEWDGEIAQGHDWNLPFMKTEELLHIYTQHKDMAKSAFMEVKSRFCREVAYTSTIESYKRLLERYKKVRKQYMNGMLSLHVT